MRQRGAAHQDGDLLHDLDAGVAGLPALLALADSLQEGQQCRNAQRTGHHGEGPRRGVAHVLVRVVDVGTHVGDHGGETGRLGQVADDLAAFDARVVVLVDEKRLDHHQNLVHPRPHQVVQLVEDAVDDFDEEVALLVFQSGSHEEWKDLVEQRPRPELARLVGDLPQRHLALGRRAVFDLQQQPQNFALLLLLGGQQRLVLLCHDLLGEGLILRLHGYIAGRLLHPQVLQRDLGGVVAHAEAGRRRHEGRGRGHRLARGRADGHVVGGRAQDFVALGGQHGVQVVVRQRAVALINLALPPRLQRVVREGGVDERCGGRGEAHLAERSGAPEHGRCAPRKAGGRLVPAAAHTLGRLRLQAGGRGGARLIPARRPAGRGGIHAARGGPVRRVPLRRLRLLPLALTCADVPPPPLARGGRFRRRRCGRRRGRRRTLDGLCLLRCVPLLLLLLLADAFLQLGLVLCQLLLQHHIFVGARIHQRGGLRKRVHALGRDDAVAAARLVLALALSNGGLLELLHGVKVFVHADRLLEHGSGCSV
mmetsp:Transcript_15797/g.40419  ORF Transcript_15797/g.40419 Transcript_15797/m.40419 type:complete len:537 (+) Transcript_15797:1904-3514(+)